MTGCLEHWMTVSALFLSTGIQNRSSRFVISLPEVSAQRLSPAMSCGCCSSTAKPPRFFEASCHTSRSPTLHRAKALIQSATKHFVLGPRVGKRVL